MQDKSFQNITLEFKVNELPSCFPLESVVDERTKLTRASQNDVKVQTVDTDRRIVLDAQIDVFLDTEAKVAGLGEVVATQLVFPDLKATLEDFLGLGAADCAVDSDLFVTADTERTHRITGLRVNRGLAGQLLQHLGRTGQPVTGLTDANVQTQFADTQITHNVLRFVLACRFRGLKQNKKTNHYRVFNRCSGIPIHSGKKLSTGLVLPRVAYHF